MQRVSKSCSLFLLPSVKAHGNCPGRSDGARPDIGNRTKPAGPTWRRENWNELCSYLGPVAWVAGPFCGGSDSVLLAPCPLGAGEFWLLSLTLSCLCAMNLSLFVWTLPLFVGGTQPCHFLCRAKLQRTKSYCWLISSTSITNCCAATIVYQSEFFYQSGNELHDLRMVEKKTISR